MNSIELSRQEFRWMLIGLITIPFVVFLSGFYLGLAQHGNEQNVQPSETLTSVAVEENSESPTTLALAEERVETPAQRERVAEETPPVEEIVAIEEPEPMPEQPPVVETTPQLKLEQLSKHLFAIQVGNFTNAANADNYKRRLQAKGIDAQVIGNISANHKPGYRVITGLYGDEKSAITAAIQQESEHDIDSYVAMLY